MQSGCWNWSFYSFHSPQISLQLSTIFNHLFFVKYFLSSSVVDVSRLTCRHWRQARIFSYWVVTFFVCVWKPWRKLKENEKIWSSVSLFADIIGTHWWPFQFVPITHAIFHFFISHFSLTFFYITFSGKITFFITLEIMNLREFFL